MQLLHQPRVGTTLVHLFERLGLVNLQDRHGMQGRGCLARSTISFGRESGCQLTGFGRETRTVPPSGGVSWAEVHRDRSLHLGNARVPSGSPAVEGSEDGGGRTIYCHPQISQSASRWSSARARETSMGGGRGCQSFQKGKVRSQQNHAHTPTTGA